MSIDKTKNLKRIDVAVEKLAPNEHNPNEMDEKQFNLLVDNIEAVGLTDPILVRPHPDKKKAKEGNYEIIGGHHRWEVAKMLGYEAVPCTVIDAKDFDDDKAKFQMVRHNVIHGRTSPQKFMKLFESLSGQYADDIVSEMFGFADQEEFRKLIKKTEKSLPLELQGQFKAAAKELKTIDDLAKLLNALFAQYGDTLPHGYMFVDFGGKKSVWLQLQAKQLGAFEVLAGQVRTKQKSLDHVFASLLQGYANGDEAVKALFDGLIETAPTVAIRADAEYATLDFLDK